MLILLVGLIANRMLSETHWVNVWPDAWLLPAASWINDLFDFMSKRVFFDTFTGKDITRATIPLVQVPTEFIESLLVNGFTEGFGARKVTLFPPFSWLGISIATVLGCYRIGGTNLAIFSFVTAMYLLMLGLWESAMLTLALLLVTVPVAAAIGLFCGILIWRSPRIKPAALLILDQLQTIPIFAYLVPIVVFFGLGIAPAIVITVIFAMPTMVRTTVVALEEAAAHASELAMSIGCNSRQRLWKVILPSAQDQLRVGLNQVVMLSFSSVIIASLVGADGLGYDVLVALRRLAVGKGLEAGLAITLLAITLNSFLQHYSSRRIERLSFLSGRSFWAVMVFVIGSTTLLSLNVSWLAAYPEALMLSTGDFFDALIKWININLYDYTNGLKVFLLVNIFFPFKNLLLALPWPAFVALVGIAGYLGGNLKRGIFLAFLTFLIVWVGLWERAILTFYLCAVAVLFSAILGIPLGVWAGRSKAAARVIIPIVDLLQTLPAFIYLIPAIMLFGTGDFPSFIAIVAFSICPAIRYTEFGIRTVPSELREAGVQFGCNSMQRLWKVELPTAGPQIILGLNRTIMMALAMLVVTALIGTSDLGQETMTALTKVDPGRGLVAGFAVAFIAIIADRLVGGLAESKLAPAKNA
jgi:glycine betaine/proline transport system permease protein